MTAYPTKDYRPGFKIEEDGIYDMPIDEYHSNNCVGPSISSSGLRILANPDLTPAHYWDTSYLNPDRAPEEEKEHFNFGHAAHMLFLGEKGFAQQFVVRPEKVDGEPWQGNRTVCKAWLKAQADAGRSVLKKEELDAIKGLAKSFAKDPLISNGIISGDIEKSMIWRDKKTGVWLKSRPDALPRNNDMIVDIKTCADASDRACQRSLVDWQYHLQLALVGEGIQHLTGRKIFSNDAMFALVFAEKKRPYLVNVKLLSADALHYGRMQLRKAIDTFAECLSNKEWPGYAGNGGELGLPTWYTDRLNEQRRSGVLPEVGT